MGKHLRSNVVAYVALFFALGMGSAWAATELTRNSVESGHIVNGEVKTRDLAPLSIHGGKLVDGAVARRHIRAGAVTQAKLADGIDADTLDGLDSGDFIQGEGEAFVGNESVNYLNVVSPDEASASLGSIPGLGSFAVRGSIREGNNCRITFTNTSGGPVAVNGNIDPGLANNETRELAGLDLRPDGTDADFTILTANATKSATGELALTHGFPGGVIVCAGAVHALVSD